MNERDFFNEQQETKRASFVCPNCRAREDYDVRWLRRTKKRELPRGAGEQDRANFQRARDYMVRVDDVLACKACRKRFDIPNSQSVVFI
jgi:ribosomal protein L44E